MQRDVYSWSNFTDVLFVADYPEMTLENYIEKDLANVSLTVLEGEVTYSKEGYKETQTIKKNKFVMIETGRFHKVKTTSPHPACYMYTFINRTKQHLANTNG